jgi:hypothetical protein
MTTSNTNPKDLVGFSKLPMHLVPVTARVYGALGHLDGYLKYGAWNWRMFGIKLSIYIDALNRHIEAIAAGEMIDPDSGLPHVSHILATANILADAYALAVLVIDTAPQRRAWKLPEPDYTTYREFINKMTPNVPRLIELHKGKNPRHYGPHDEIIVL